jgi:alanyl-tRNA synthetase
MAVDRDGFEREMDAQRMRARGAQRFSDVTAGPELLAGGEFTTRFVGDRVTELESEVLALLTHAGETRGPVAAGETVQVVTAETPFYPEGGGQVGDHGVITSARGLRVEVDDTRRIAPGVIAHRGTVREGAVEVGERVRLVLDAGRRDRTRLNHSATHLMHAALRERLGGHVQQAGSLVDPDRLRFDFGPADALTPVQIQEIEDLANAEILANDPVRHYETTKAEAANLGAIAFFGDKYGDVVRVLEAGRKSIELCGGTHVRALGDIGPVKIVSEASIGANLRRIEAVTGTGPIERLRDEERRLAELAEVLNVPVGEVVDGARKRLEEIRSLRDEVKTLKRQAAGGQAASLASRAVDGVVVERVDGLERDTLRDLALALRDQNGLRAVVLATAPEGGGAALVAAVTPDSGYDASALLEEAKKLIKGGGGKDPLLAVAGGKDADGIDAALVTVRAAAGIQGS